MTFRQKAPAFSLPPTDQHSSCPPPRLANPFGAAISAFRSPSLAEGGGGGGGLHEPGPANRYEEATAKLASPQILR